MTTELTIIHNSLIAGQKKAAVKLIDQYGNYDFWADYKLFLLEWYNGNQYLEYEQFADTVISYNRIKNR